MAPKKIRLIGNRKSQMNVVMAIMLIAILLASTIFFWRTSDTFSKSYSENIDEKSFENVATYIENVVAHNEIAWIERTLVETNLTIPLHYDGANYVGENEFFKITYVNPTTLSLSSKNSNSVIVDTEQVNLNTRFYIDGSYNIYPNPTIPALKDKNIIGDFFVYKIESQTSGRGQEYIVHLTPTFKSAVIGDAGQPPESLAKTCFLLEYPKSKWAQYYNNRTNEYSVYPSNYYIINVKDDGLDKRYINYCTNILIPSNSTMLDSLSVNPVPDILNNYIKSGGSLIMFTQDPDKKEKYDFLPVNIVFDKSEYDTVGVSKQHEITNNIYPYELSASYYSSEGTIVEPFFDNAANEILFREIPFGTYNNNNPSVVLSSWGAGKILTTSIPIDVKSILDDNISVCPWWDPDTIGAGHDWHFRRNVEVDPGNYTRINEPIEIIIDPTAEINKLAKEGFLTLENTNLDFDSIRVIELINGDCYNPVEIESQVYPYRPNLQSAGYYGTPEEFHEHTIFFELEAPSDIRLEMYVPSGSQYKDEYNNQRDFHVYINDIVVAETIQGSLSNVPGYWDPYNGGQSDGPRSFSCILNAKYFHKGDNKIRLVMDYPADLQYNWYENVLFRLYEHTSRGDTLFFQEYPPLYVYFSMGANDAGGRKQGTQYSRTFPGQKRYYDIYFDIVENGKKPVPSYRQRITDGQTPTTLWSFQIDNPVIFNEDINITSIGIVRSNQFPILMNVSSPSTADINDDGVIDIVLGLRNGNVTAIDGSTHSIIWSRKVSDKFPNIISSNKAEVFAPIAVSSPTICDINRDNRKEIVVGGGNLKVTVTKSGSKTNFEFETAPGNVSVLDALTGQILWKITTAALGDDKTGETMVSSPAIADVNNDGYEDIAFVSTKLWRFNYEAGTSNFVNTPVYTRTYLYLIDGRTHQALSIEGGNKPSYGQKFVSYRLQSDPYTPYILLPTSSPTIGDVNGDGLLEVVWGGVDGNVYTLYQSGNNNWRKWNVGFTAPDSKTSLNRPMGYFISSPVIAETDYRKNRNDIIVSVVETDSNGQNAYLSTYVIDGLNQTTRKMNIISRSHSSTNPNYNNTLIAGNPIIYSPNGFHLRGPQIIVSAGEFLMFQHVDLTHQVRGRITQSSSYNFLDASYASPAIVDVNNYDSFYKKDDCFFFDCIIGTENGKLYAVSYRDTTAGDDTSSESTYPPGSDNDKLHLLWEYNANSPIRSSVAVDDIDNDGKSEIVFASHNGYLTALNVGYNYRNWNYARHTIAGDSNVDIKINPVTYKFYEPEAILLGSASDPYDDVFRVLAEFELGASKEENIFGAYVAEDWIKIDTNHNDLVSDELVIYEKDLTQLGITTYEGKLVGKTYQVESIYGDIINSDFILTFLDRGLIKLFDNIMAYTSAPTRNIQIEEGIWVNLDIPDNIGGREYVIQGLGDRIRIYDPQNPKIEVVRELRGTNLYGTISSISKNKYVVITSYGAYLSPNPG